MKKRYLLFMLFTIFLIPTIVRAKAITCTSSSNYTVGKNVYDGVSISCNDGSVEVFAVTELNKGYVENGYTALEGKTYFMDIIWTGNFDSGVDSIIIDGDNQTNFAFDCEYGCHFTTRSLVAKSSSESAPQPTQQPNSKPVHINVYWVNFNTNGGSIVENQAIEEGKTAIAPTNPIKEGYKFVEWQLDGKKFDFNTKITKTIELKAKWVEDTIGKSKIPYIYLTSLSGPIGGSKLDTQYTIDTNKNWTKEYFEPELRWYYSKSKDIEINYDNMVKDTINEVAKEGYYYQPVITIKPGSGYTLNGTLVKLNSKSIKYTVEENKIVIKGQVYGPIKNGENSDPAIIIKDQTITVYKNDTDVIVPIEILYDKNRMDEVTVDGDSFLKVTNPDYFEADKAYVLGSGLRNLAKSCQKYSDENSICYVADIKLKKNDPGQYGTEVYFVDTEGREYRGTITIIRSWEEPKPVKVESKDKNYDVLLEFLAGAEQNWQLHFKDLTDGGSAAVLDGYEALTSGDIKMLAVYDIKLTSDEGEKTNGTFKLKLLMSDQLKQYKNFEFVYVNPDLSEGYHYGEKVKAYVEGDYLVVNLPHLSTYALVGIPDNSIFPLKNVIYIVIFVVCILGIVGAVLYKKSKK